MHANRSRTARRLGLAATLLVAFSGATARADGLPKLKTEVAFPNLRFDRPVALAYPDDGSNRLFVVEQHKGTIQAFVDAKDTGETKEFFKLPDPLNKGNEEGLLGLAFHPKYKQNGEFFVYYSAHDEVDGKHERHSVVSRFKVSKDDPTQGRLRRPRSGSGSRPRTPSRTTTAAASPSAPTASSTSRWATAAPPTTP